MATLTEAMVYTKEGETVTVPAKLFVDLVEACGWVPGLAASVNLEQIDDPNSVKFLSSEAFAINKQARDWIAQNWRPIDKGDCEF